MNKISFKTHPIVAGGLVVLILAGAATFLRSMSQDDLKQELVAKESEATRLADNVRYGQKLDVQYNRLVELNKELSTRLTDSSDLATNQQYFYKIEAATGVKISDLRQVTVPKKKNATPSLFAPVPYLISVTGNFTQVLNFLRSVESGPRICRITAGTVTTPTVKEGAPAVISLNITAELVGAL